MAIIKLRHPGSSGRGLVALSLAVLVAGLPLAAAAQPAGAQTAGGPIAASADRTAFPGASGYGAGADGWRGGTLIAVTNLDDSGPGSLRACVEADGPRICIFRVAGTIRLDGPLMARSDLYIAGQTAPGGGIQLRIGNSDHGPLIIKNAHDVVVRFLKLRPGPGPKKTPNIDAMTVENASNLYLGNLSMMFASDETFNIHVSGGQAVDITLADSILAYSLDRANHPKGRHSKGALICSDEASGNECGRISLLRNIFAHHRDRNPDIKATDAGPVEVVNNIFYDAISQFGEFYDLLGDTRIAYVGNLALGGPSTSERAASSIEVFDWTEGNDISVWAADNQAHDCADARALEILSPEAELAATATPIPLTVLPMPAADLLTALPTTAGDVLPWRPHDRLEQQILADLTNCTGQVIDRPRQAGGWVEIGSAEAPADSDGDLIPDTWEAGHPGLDPARADDPWQPAGPGGLSLVETWLAELAGDA